jgi:hypothetical protein
MAFQVVYDGQYTGNVGMSIKQDPLAQQYWNQTMTRNSAPDSSLTANVNFLQSSSPAIYKRLTAVSFFTTPTTSVAQLLRSFPQMASLTAMNLNQRKFRDHFLDMTFQRRFAGGLSLNGAVSLHCAQDWSTIIFNEYDLGPTRWFTTNNARPWRITATGLYFLPFGKARKFWQTGTLAAVAGGWQIGGTHEITARPAAHLAQLFGQVTATSGQISRWYTLVGRINF